MLACCIYTHVSMAGGWNFFTKKLHSGICVSEISWHGAHVVGVHSSTFACAYPVCALECHLPPALPQSSPPTPCAATLTIGEQCTQVRMSHGPGSLVVWTTWLLQIACLPPLHLRVVTEVSIEKFYGWVGGEKRTCMGWWMCSNDPYENSTLVKVMSD